MKHQYIIRAMLLLLAACFFSPTISAQQSPIPDPNFRAWIQANYPTCMSQGYIIVGCDFIETAMMVNVNGLDIANLNGIQYFSSLRLLQCENNLLTTLHTLPASVEGLWCNDNQLTALPTLPASLHYLACQNNQLTSLPSLPFPLQDLVCHNNKLTFEDLEPHMHISHKSYSPQAPVPVSPSTQNIPAGGTLTLTVSTGGTANRYQWFKDGVAVSAISTSPGYIKTGFTTADAGVYTCQITSTIVTNLTLYTTPVTVTTDLSNFSWTGVVSIDWFNASNWASGMVPGLATSVTIPVSAPNMPVINATGAVCKNISIAPGANCRTAVGGVLNIKGNLVNNGAFNSSGGTVVFSGSTTQTVSGSGSTSFYNATLDNTAGLTLQSASSVKSVLTLRRGNLASNSNLTLLSTASQTALVDDFDTGNMGSISGNITVQRYIATPGTHYVASPVSGAKAGDFGQYQMASYYNESQVTAASTSIDAGWMNIANTTIVNPVTGLSSYYDAAKTVSLSGTAGTGNFSTTVTRTTAGSFAGYNVIGNPYPSPVSWSLIWNLNNNTNIHKTVYVWNNALNKSALYNFATNQAANGGTDEIALGQAFRIRVNTAPYSTTFNLNNSVRLASSSNNFLRKQPEPVLAKLRLVLSYGGDKAGYETLIHSGNGATDGIDAAYDGEFPGDKGMAVIYSKADGTPMTINALPELKGDRTVPLGVEVQQPGQYTISATEIEGFSPGTKIYLEDRRIGRLVDLAAEPSYQVYIDKPEPNRFFVHFMAAAKEEAAIASFVNIYAEGSEVTVQFSKAQTTVARIAVVNMLGETVAEVSNDQQVARLRVDQPAGTYLVRVESDGGMVTRKVFISGR